MKKLFLDSDVLLDLLLDREPFSDDIATLIEKSIDSEIKLCTSPISITNINYIIGRLENKNKADLKTCLLYTSPSPRDQRGSRMPSSA